MFKKQFNMYLNRTVKKAGLVLLLVCTSMFVSTAQQYPKAILPGDYPDPTIVRDGADYYMTHSPFYYMPGFLIWHSQDLVNWQPISRVVPEYTGSAMAPDLIKHEGKFYLYFPSAGTNWVVWADDIRGPWSKPIDLRVSGIDPGHVVGEDGKRYLYVDKGYVIRLADDGLSTLGERQLVYDGWDYPKSWETEGKYLESPKLIFKDGYYYMTSAEGGTAGPPTSHMVIAARSRSVLGPWENSPYNPIVHTYSANENWWSKGHGTIIDDVNGNWWIVYHAYANGYHILGRQTLLEPIEWTSDGWYKLKSGADPITPQIQVKHGLELSDNFDKPDLSLQWTFWKEYTPASVAIKENTLQLQAKGATPADARKLLTTATDKNYEVQVEIQPEKGNNAGLVLFYNEQAYAGIVSDGKNFTIYQNAETSFTLPNLFGKRFFLKILNRGNTCTFYASQDNKEWMTLAQNIDVSNMHHNNYGGFYALRPGLVSAGKGRAGFRNFVYRDAKPTEDDMSAYLMVFHNDATHGLHMALSTDGYSFTALNDGRPVISGDTIADQKGIRDPHIYRGPDGAFYMAMTDLHVFGKRDGLRDTEWERDGKTYGWGNNRGLVLMKSWDLIHWKRTNIRFDELSAQYKEVGCVWAPETTYDEEKGKLMIYFTMRYQSEPNKLYYAYVNEDFDRLETSPQILFEYPNEKVSAIDGDITKVGEKYRMFYVSHDGEAGIKQVVSDKINGGYEFDPRWYDPEERACEAPNVWKRIGEEKWVLMYDCYGQQVHNFGFSETSDFVNFKNLGQFNQGVMKTTNFTSPKHGAIIHLTKEEADRLAAQWGLNMEFATVEEYRAALNNRPPDLSLSPNANNPVLPGLYADPEVLYAKKTGKYYIYPTTDGFKGWEGTHFKAFSSDDLQNWKDEGVILDLKKDVSWADRNACAPSIIEKKDKGGNYKYYYYFTAAQKIGVAVADNPLGPFIDSGKPLIDQRPEGMTRGQNIDPDVFTDPNTGKSYLYWGNYFMAVCELNDDMVSVKPNTVRILIADDEFYSEAVYVFYRQGFYYFMWSKNDTSSPDYEVRYVKSKSPIGPIDASLGKVILSKNPEKGIYATGHHSILEIPNKDEWYIVYHRFQRPDAVKLGKDAGYNREVCIDKMQFDEKGDIIAVIPTL